MWKKNDKLIIAVSGGPDSICLLDCLAHLQKKYAWGLHVAHVNYGLRERDADADEQLVQEKAKLYNIPYSVLRAKKTHQKNNLEEHLRNIRYDFFEQLRYQLGFDAIVTAHHRDDQAETILLHLLRGCGMRGLGAMRPKNDHIIRPFLLTSKSDILTYLQYKQLSFRLDATNETSLFTRNRIRLEVIPLLQKLNPNIVETLARTALSLADDADALSSHFKEKFTKKNTSTFLASIFNSLHPTDARAFLRTLIEETTSKKCIPTFNQLEELRKLIRSTKNKLSEKTLYDLKFTRKGDKVSVLVKIPSKNSKRRISRSFTV